MSKTKTRTILVVATGIFLLLGTWQSSTARAEVAKTTKNTRVMQRRGERSRVLLRVPQGRTVKVISRKGRWVKIRYKGRTGWVTRSSLTATSARKVRKRRRRRRPFVEGRDKERDFSGSGPKDRIGADAVDPEDAGDAVMVDEEEIGDGESIEEEVLVDEMPEEELEDEWSEADEIDVIEEEWDEEEDVIADESPAEKDIYEIMVATEKTALYRRPSTRSKRIYRVFEGAKLIVLERSKSGTWMLVENAEGDQGWIRASLVARPGYKPPAFQIRTSARAGFTALSQTFSSDGGAEYELANYTIASNAASVAVGGDVMYRVMPSIMVAADVMYNGSYSSPGIRYQNADGQAADTAFMVHEVNAGAGAGYTTESGMAFYARAGYHYTLFGIQNYANPEINLARLPSEILQGMTLGVRMVMPRLSDNIALRIGGDALYPAANRAQTAGLTDGTLDSVFAAWGTALLSYRWTPSFNIEAGYRYAYAKTTWEGPAERPTGALTESARTDITHLISLGVAKAF